MQAWRWLTAAVVAVVVVAIALASILGGGGDDRVTTRTERGIRWSVDGAVVAVTVTEDAPASVRRRLRGRVDLGCRLIGSADPTREITVAGGAARFAGGPGTTRIRLSPRLERVDACSLTTIDVVASVRFSGRTERPDSTLVIP